MKKIAIAVAAALGVAAASSGVTYWVVRTDTWPAANVVPKEGPAPSPGAGIDALFQADTDRILDYRAKQQLQK